MELENSIHSYTGLFTHCAPVKGFSTLYLYLQRFSFFPFFLPSQYYSWKERGNTGLKIQEISLRDQKTLLLDFHPYNQCTADATEVVLVIMDKKTKVSCLLFKQSSKPHYTTTFSMCSAFISFSGHMSHVLILKLAIQFLPPYVSLLARC